MSKIKKITLTYFKAKNTPHQNSKYIKKKMVASPPFSSAKETSHTRQISLDKL